MIEPLSFPGSSSLLGGTYNAEAQYLTLTFRSGATYGYDNVPQGVVEGLKTSPSPGSYFYWQIRNRYTSHER